MLIVNVGACSAQLIHCDAVHKATRKSFPVTVVYDFNDTDVRDCIWRELVVINRKIQGARLVMRDFNNMLNLEDRIW